MATGVEELLDMLFEMIDEAKSMPLSSDKCILERDKALDLLDEIRAQFPMELAEAKKLIAARTEYIASAKREGELIRKQAEEKARQMVSEDELLAQTKQKANELMRTAEERSRDLRKAANDYCEDALRRTEEAVAEAYDEIKKSRARFRAAASATAEVSEPPRPRVVMSSYLLMPWKPATSTIFLLSSSFWMRAVRTRLIRALL